MNKKKIIIFLVLIVIVTGFIFSNSLKNIEESNESSGTFVEVLEPIIEYIAGSDADVNFIVRKGAHLAEFFVLGFWVMFAVSEMKKKIAAFAGYGLFYVLLVAVTDEFIQSFFNRTSSVRDVFIDFTGAIIGFAACIILNYFINQLKCSLMNKTKKGSDYGCKN